MEALILEPEPFEYKEYSEIIKDPTLQPIFNYVKYIPTEPKSESTIKPETKLDHLQEYAEFSEKYPEKFPRDLTFRTLKSQSAFETSQEHCIRGERYREEYSNLFFAYQNVDPMMERPTISSEELIQRRNSQLSAAPQSSSGHEISENEILRTQQKEEALLKLDITLLYSDLNHLSTSRSDSFLGHEYYKHRKQSLYYKAEHTKLGYTWYDVTNDYYWKTSLAVYLKHYEMKPIKPIESTKSKSLFQSTLDYLF